MDDRTAPSSGRGRDWEDGWNLQWLDRLGLGLGSGLALVSALTVNSISARAPTETICQDRGVDWEDTEYVSFHIHWIIFYTSLAHPILVKKKEKRKKKAQRTTEENEQWLSAGTAHAMTLESCWSWYTSENDVIKVKKVRERDAVDWS